MIYFYLKLKNAMQSKSKQSSAYDCEQSRWINSWVCKGKISSKWIKTPKSRFVLFWCVNELTDFCNDSFFFQKQFSCVQNWLEKINGKIQKIETQKQ